MNSRLDFFCFASHTQIPGHCVCVLCSKGPFRKMGSDANMGITNGATHERRLKPIYSSMPFFTDLAGMVLFQVLWESHRA